MKKETAKQILQALNASANALNQAEALARTIEDETERRNVRKALAIIGASLYTDGMGMVFAQFPELEKRSNR